MLAHRIIMRNLSLKSKSKILAVLLMVLYSTSDFGRICEKVVNKKNHLKLSGFFVIPLGLEPRTLGLKG
ncbi:MAG: hypothetical protein U9R42_04350, partial [Bacteroidota bacterium]|nr:hypothetical protein [Bacteroidota bacterium]